MTIHPVTALIALVCFFAVASLLGIAFRRSAARADRERAERVRAWAEKNGFTFSPFVPGTASMPNVRSQGVRLFTLGTRQRITSLCTKTIEHQGHTLTLSVADFAFRRSHGEPWHDRMFSFAVLETPLTGMPVVRVRAEHQGDRVDAAAGFNDIDFEDARFSKAAHVSSSDPRFAYDLLDPRMIECLRRTPTVPSVEFVGSDILYYPGNAEFVQEPWGEAGFDAAIEHLLAIYAAIPAHLARAHTA